MNSDKPFRYVEDGLKFKLTLDGKVLNGKVVLPVIRKALVERAVLLLSNVVRVTSPDRLRLIEFLVNLRLLLNLLGLLLFLVFLIIYLLNLGLVSIFSILLSLGLILILDLL